MRNFLRFQYRLKTALLVTLSQLIFDSLSLAANAQEANPSKPHPWLNLAPTEYLRLIDVGNVELKIDDDFLNRNQKNAITVFKVLVDMTFSTNFKVTPSNTGKSNVRFTVRYGKPKLRMDHTIIIRSTLRPVDPWKDIVLQHEMDHVAISTDPRLALMVNYLYSEPQIWDELIESTSPPSSATIDEQVQRHSKILIGQIERAIQIQYDWLDQKTNQGMSSLVKRSDFFWSLYSHDLFKDASLPDLKPLKQRTTERWTDSVASKIEMHYRIEPRKKLPPEATPTVGK